MRSRALSPVQPTTGVLSPRKVVTKRTGTSSAGRVAQVAALSVVQVNSPTYSPQYSPASPSPPRYYMTGAKRAREGAHPAIGSQWYRFPTGHGAVSHQAASNLWPS